MTMPARPVLSNAWLARMAAAEAATRERAYPGRIEAGAIDRAGAEADIEAWRVIAALMRDGSVETDLGWPDLLRAATVNLTRRREGLARAGRDGVTDDRLRRLRERETAARSIHERIAWAHDVRTCGRQEAAA